MRKEYIDRIIKLERRIMDLELKLDSELNFSKSTLPIPCYGSSGYSGYSGYQINIASIKGVINLILEHLGLEFDYKPSVPPETSLKNKVVK